MTGDSVLGATDLKGCRDRVTEKGEIKCFNVASQHGAVLSVSVLDTAPIRAKMAPVPATFVPVPFFSAGASVCPCNLRLVPSLFSAARRSMMLPLLLLRIDITGKNREDEGVGSEPSGSLVHVLKMVTHAGKHEPQANQCQPETHNPRWGTARLLPRVLRRTRSACARARAFCLSACLSVCPSISL